MYIVLFCENVISLRLFERVCWLPYFEKCKLCLQDLEHVLYAAVMLLKIYKITSLEKKIFVLQVFSKQHGFASRDSLVVGSNGWGFCGVAGTLPASRGGSVTSWYQSRVLGTCVIKHRSFLIHYFTLLATMHFQIQSTYILSVSKY